MISYCIACFRPTYARLLIEELIAKTTARYEILVWLNLENEAFETFLLGKIQNHCPIKIVGKTPENIGMQAYRELFRRTQHELIAQIDDDVIMISKRIAENAMEVFTRHKNIKQLVTDVWQDEFTTGARPPMNAYRMVNAECGLYDGPIDGWFSVYHRSILPLISAIPRAPYFPIGLLTKQQLQRQGLKGLLCRKFKVFHVIGPQYASFFNMLDFEIDKYKKLGRREIVQWYERERHRLPESHILEKNIEKIRRELSQ